MSDLRKRYFVRLIMRSLVFVACIVSYFLRPEWFDILNKGQFFTKFSPLHLLWFAWILGMIQQLVPIKKKLAIGSLKLFKENFKPSELFEKLNFKHLQKHVVTTTKAAYKVFLLWTALIAVIGVLYHFDVINKIWLFMFSVTFYVCDLICVLVWCPFRLIMKNKCCTTCRIFNWDHLMMFTPLIFMGGGFFSISLLVMAIAAWLVWELCVMLYPERFWEYTNSALKCSECTDKLCTQYCQKLRKK